MEAPNQGKKDPSENEFKKEKVTRRHFLKLVGAAGTLATLATVIPFGKIFANSNTVTNTNQNRKHQSTNNTTVSEYS